MKTILYISKIPVRLSALAAGPRLHEEPEEHAALQACQALGDLKAASPEQLM